MTLRLAQGLRLRRYRVSGLVLASELHLPELTPLQDQPVTKGPEILVRLAGEGHHFPEISDWFLTMTLPDGEPWLSCGRVTVWSGALSADGYLLHFPGLGDFLVDAAGQEIACKAKPGTGEEALRHLLLNQVLPLVLNLRGREVLHATTVLTPAGACAFAGQTGSGKSTLAAGFLLAGYPVISDDCLLLDERNGHIAAIPAYPGIRLWDDALEALHGAHEKFPTTAPYTTKRRLLVPNQREQFPAEPVPLARVYCLEGSAGCHEEEPLSPPSIRRLRRRDSFMHLLPCLFRLDIQDRAMLTRQFLFLDRLVARVPVRQLVVPPDFSSLPLVREAVLADLRTG